MQRSTLVAARVLAALGAVFWGYFFFGVQDTLTVLDEGEDFAADYLMESGWGLLFLFLVGAPLVGLAVRPRTTRLVAEVIAAGVAVAMGAGLAQSAKHLLPAAGLIGTALLVAVLARPELDLRRPHADLPLLIWTLVAIGPGSATRGTWRTRRPTSPTRRA